MNRSEEELKTKEEEALLWEIGEELTFTVDDLEDALLSLKFIEELLIEHEKRWTKGEKG